MVDEPDSIVLRHLREIRAKQEEHTGRFDMLHARVDAVEKQLSRVSKLLTNAIGQSDETKFLQAQQDDRIDELFSKLEELLSRPQPG